jgi:hypothetical protein
VRGVSPGHAGQYQRQARAAGVLRPDQQSCSAAAAVIASQQAHSAATGGPGWRAALKRSPQRPPATAAAQPASMAARSQSKAVTRCCRRSSGWHGSSRRRKWGKGAISGRSWHAQVADMHAKPRGLQRGAWRSLPAVAGEAPCAWASMQGWLCWPLQLDSPAKRLIAGAAIAYCFLVVVIPFLNVFIQVGARSRPRPATCLHKPQQSPTRAAMHPRRPPAQPHSSRHANCIWTMAWHPAPASGRRTRRGGRRTAWPACQQHRAADEQPQPRRSPPPPPRPSHPRCRRPLPRDSCRSSRTCLTRTSCMR